MKKGTAWFPPKKLIQVPGLSRDFNEIQRISRIFTNSNNKISFLQNKNKHPVVYKITASSKVKAK